jgi:hypothetical protein
MDNAIGGLIALEQNSKYQQLFAYYLEYIKPHPSFLKNINPTILIYNQYLTAPIHIRKPFLSSRSQTSSSTPNPKIK